MLVVTVNQIPTRPRSFALCLGVGDAYAARDHEQRGRAVKNGQPEITGILFDKDGTLFDFEATWGAWAKGFLTEITDGDIAAATRLGQAIGFDFAQARYAPDSLAIAGTQHQVAAALGAHLPGIADDDLLARMNTSAATAPLVPAVPLRPVMSDLSDRGIVLGLATNDAEAPALAHLDAAGVRHFFDFVAGCDSGFGHKPQSGQLDAFCAKFGIDPQTVLMVGDSVHDLHAGRAAGMITIGVLSGPAGQDDLSPHADVILPDISHLPGWIDQIRH